MVRGDIAVDKEGKDNKLDTNVLGRTFAWKVGDGKSDNEFRHGIIKNKF